MPIEGKQKQLEIIQQEKKTSKKNRNKTCQL